MRIAYTDDQLALRDELRAYFAELVTPEVAAEMAQGEMGGKKCLEAVAQMGKRRLARRRLAEGVRRPRLRPDGAVHLLRRGAAGRRAGAVPHDQHRRADDHAVRHARAEELLPAAHPRGRVLLLDRLHRARGRHRPRVAQDAGRARRRRVGHQRAEDLHEPDRPRRLHLARGAAPTPTPASTRASRSSSCPTDVGGLLLHARSARSATRRPTRPTTRTCACPVANTVGEIDGGWTVITDQLNYERISLASPAILERNYARGAALGAGHEAARRAAGHRPGVGADQPGEGARAARGAAAAQLEEHLAGQRRQGQHRRRVRR